MFALRLPACLPRQWTIIELLFTAHLYRKHIRLVCREIPRHLREGSYRWQMILSYRARPSGLSRALSWDRKMSLALSGLDVEEGDAPAGGQLRPTAWESSFLCSILPSG